MRRWLLFALPIALAIVIASCGGGGDGAESTTSTEPSETEAAEATGFSEAVLPIFAERCAACHAAGGPGTGHWTLDTVDDIVANHAEIATIVGSETMPPWPAGGDSPAFHEDRSLQPGQIQAIVDWSAAGAPLDVAADTAIVPAVEVVGLADPEVTLTAAQPYPGSGSVDDYRCQVYDPQLADGGWITAYEFIPDQTEVVHHAIGYLLPAAAREAAAQLDGSDGRPGWQCYGSSGLGEDDIFLGWAPGQLPSELPGGTGLWVEPGAFIVVQIHYHYEADAPTDASALALAVTEGGRSDLDEVVVTDYVAPAEIPCAVGESGPLCDRDAAFAAAVDRYGREGVQANGILGLCGARPEDFAHMTDGTASASCDIPAGLIGGTGEIVSVLGHEHEIGSWFKLTLNPGTPDEQVLLDIPDWDFDWQYNYAPVDRIVIEPDDIVRIECGWDRARRDPELEPAYVLWADGTNDEMCFATITTRP